MFAPLIQMSDPNRLPSTFKSLYRLFLRVASASVLHHPRASRNLRRRWRPTFNDAARITRGIQQETESESDRQVRIEWLDEWNKRSTLLKLPTARTTTLTGGKVDNTLEFFYTSSHTRGIPNAVTRALAFAVQDERARALTKMYARKTWKPTNPDFATQHLKSLEKQKKQESIDNNSQGSLEEILKMAEATSNLHLGTNKISLGHYVYRRAGR